MRTLKLFQILDTEKNKILPDSFFTDKMQAKKKRTALNGIEAEQEGKFRFVVTLGPDHRRYSQQTQETIQQ